MEKISITFDLERTAKIYSKYFDFEKKRALKKFPFLIILALSSFLILLGIFLETPFWMYFGIISIVLTAAFFISFSIRFEMAFRKFMRSTEESIVPSEVSYSFSFDETGMMTESENSMHKVTWDLIHSFEENQNDLYLFMKNNQIYDIISESILGEEQYERFRNILQQKVKPRIL